MAQDGRLRALRAVGVPLLLGLAQTWAAAEHASAGKQVGLAIPFAMVHLLAMAFWMGGLVALCIALWRSSPDRPVPAMAVSCFSRLAFLAITALVGTGIYQSWRQLGSWEALSSASYGRWLALKIAIVLALLAVAALSRRWAIPRCPRRRTPRPMRRDNPATAVACCSLSQPRPPSACCSWRSAPLSREPSPHEPPPNRRRGQLPQPCPLSSP
ncbi:copper resistance D family protein [Streptomyces sp. NPDC059909]|uniref:copper resistance D family protein n=1 Tax=Streptomyces sp. NPDC059909 TaxID=3346998 RepID=UPI00364B422E